VFLVHAEQQEHFPPEPAQRFIKARDLFNVWRGAYLTRQDVPGR